MVSIKSKLITLLLHIFRHPQRILQPPNWRPNFGIKMIDDEIDLTIIYKYQYY